MATEIPKVPRQFAIFPYEDLAGVGYNSNPFDVNPTGQPYANVPPSPYAWQGPNMTPMAGADPNFPMLGPAPFTPQLPMAQPVGPPQPSPFAGVVQPMSQPMLPQQPMPEPPPGAQAMSPGPIARLKNFLMNAYNQDPQQFMLQMAAFSQSATNPQLAVGMGQQAVNQQREDELTRQKIDAQREYKEARQKETNDWRFRQRVDRAVRDIQNYGLDPNVIMPPGEIETEEDLLYVIRRTTQERHAKQLRKEWGEELHDLIKNHDTTRGFLPELREKFRNLPEAVEDYEHLRGHLNNVVKNWEEADKRVKEKHASLMAYRDEALKRAKTQEQRDILNKAFSAYMKEYETMQRRADTVRKEGHKDKRLDAFDTLSHFEGLTEEYEFKAKNIMTRAVSLLLDAGGDEKVLNSLIRNWPESGDWEEDAYQRQEELDRLKASRPGEGAPAAGGGKSQREELRETLQNMRNVGR